MLLLLGFPLCAVRSASLSRCIQYRRRRFNGHWSRFLAGRHPAGHFEPEGLLGPFKGFFAPLGLTRAFLRFSQCPIYEVRQLAFLVD